MIVAEVEAGDLEAVEEQAGAAGVDLVLRDALQDEADVVLDGGAVFGEGEVELGVVAAVGDGFAEGGAAGAVVVVAEGFVAEGSAAAAVAVGEDVAALPGLGEGFGLCALDGFGHDGSPLVRKVCKVRRNQDLSLDF